MTRVSKADAVSELHMAGVEKVSDYDYTIYADGECKHCGSHFSYGHIDVEDGTVDAVELQALLEDIERRSGNAQ